MQQQSPLFKSIPFPFHVVGGHARCATDSYFSSVSFSMFVARLFQRTEMKNFAGKESELKITRNFSPSVLIVI